jgi:nitronate monooxygenase
MAGGPSTPALTAAVARAGGFGFVAGGYLSTRQLDEQIAATSALSDVPFGVNLFCPSVPAERPELLERYARAIQPEAERLGVSLGEPLWDGDSFGEKLGLVADRGIALVSFTFGCPRAAETDELHRAGCLVAVTVTSLAEARFAEERGADLLLAQGTEAGGHQGGFLELAANETALLDLVDELTGSLSLPVVGSGGVMTGTDVARVLDHGAIAVALGTAFLCAHEAGTSTIYREVLLEQTYETTMLTRAFSGRFARGLANEFARRYSEAAPAAYPEIHHLTRPLRTAATSQQDPTTPNFWAGQGWKRVRAEPAAVIVARLVEELHAAR